MSEPIALREYCPGCKETTESRMEQRADATFWYCKVCGELVDQSIDNDYYEDMLTEEYEYLVDSGELE